MEEAQRKLAARKPQFAPASGEAGAADPEEPADEAADPEEINLCYDDSAQGSSARTFLGRTLDIFRGAGAVVAREDDTAEVALTEAQAELADAGSTSPTRARWWAPALATL